MSMFESGGDNVFEETSGGIYNSPAISGDLFQDVGDQTVEEDVLNIRAGGSRPNFPRATPGIPYTLGQLGGVKGNKSDWMRYQQLALSEAATFKNLSEQAGRVSCPVLKAKIVNFLGHPSDQTSPAYRYSRVMVDIADAQNKEKYGAAGYMEYSESRRQNRVDDLKKWNKQLVPMVRQAITQCGLTTVQQPTVKPKTKWGVSVEQALDDAKAAYAVAKNTKEGIQIQNFWYKAKIAVDAARTQPMSSWKRPGILGQAKALLATAEKMLAANRVPKPAEPDPEMKPERKNGNGDRKDKLPMGLILGGGAAALAVMMLMMQRR